jgi:hypothetical protein
MKQISLLLVVSFFVAGCTRTLQRKSSMDPYLVANLQKLDNTIIVGVYDLNERLSKIEGNKDKRSWAFVALDNNGSINEFLATDYNLWDREKCKKKLLIFIPGEGQIGRLGGVVDRAGLKIYNHKGEERWIKNPYGKIKATDYDGFLPVINPSSDYFLIMQKDSAAFQFLDNSIRSNAIFQMMYFKEYISKQANRRYGVPLGTMVPDWVLDRMAAEDDIVKRFVVWAGSGWKAFLSVPFMGATKTLIQMGLFKLMEIPDIFSMIKNQPTMEEVVDAIEQAEEFEACRADRRADRKIEMAIKGAMEQLKRK